MLREPPRVMRGIYNCLLRFLSYLGGSGEFAVWFVRCVL